MGHRAYAVMDFDENENPADEPRYVAGHEGWQDPLSYFAHDTSYSCQCAINLGVANYLICHMRYPLGRCYLIHRRAVAAASRLFEDLHHVRALKSQN